MATESSSMWYGESRRIFGEGVIVPVAIFPVEITAVTIKTPQPGWLGLRIVNYRFRDNHSTT